MEQKATNRRTNKPRGNTIIELDHDIETLKVIEQLKIKGYIAKEAFLKLISQTSQILYNQSTVLRLKSPIFIVGDIHGQFYDLLKIFQNAGPVSNTTYLFLGDYVDRGKFCIQALTLLLKLKRTYPNNIFLLRGNHQGKLMTSFFNFKLQCQKKYNSYVYEAVIDLFKKLPLCALIDNKYFAVHGGISPKLNLIHEIERVNRFVQINDEQGMSDLLWSDPSDAYNDEFIYNKLRCCSYFYSPMQSQSFLKNNQLSLIIRGHQVSDKGYKYQLSKQNTPLTLTVFSAPNYCDTYHNKAVILFLKNNHVELKSFKQSENPLLLSSYNNVFDLTLPILTSYTTSLFKNLIKKSHQRDKKRNSSQKKQDLLVLKNIQTLENHFSAQSSKILSFLMSHKKQQQPNEMEFSEEMLFRFLALKTSDIAQKYPLIIGPRNIIFEKVNCNLSFLEQIQPQVDGQLTF